MINTKLKKAAVSIIASVIVSMSLSVSAFASAKPLQAYEYSGQSSAAKAKAAAVIATVITPGMTTTEKVRAIHDYMIVTTVYDEQAYTTGKSVIGGSTYTADGPILYGTGVCQGYSEAFKLYMDLLGIPCTILSDDALNHAWNQVTVDGVSYEIDVTWDDPIPDGGPKLDEFSHVYFLLSTEQMKKLHDPTGIYEYYSNLYGEDILWGDDYYVW